MGVPWDEMYLRDQFASFDVEDDEDRVTVWLTPEERAKVQQAMSARLQLCAPGEI